MFKRLFLYHSILSKNPEFSIYLPDVTDKLFKSSIKKWLYLSHNRAIQPCVGLDFNPGFNITTGGCIMCLSPDNSSHNLVSY